MADIKRVGNPNQFAPDDDDDVERSKQQHPSRRVRNAEWMPEEATEHRPAGFRVLSGGFYTAEEMEAAPRIWRDEGEPALEKAYTNPQGVLFDADALEQENRRTQLSKRLDVGESPNAAALRNKIATESTIPSSHLRERLNMTGETELRVGHIQEERGVAGTYRPERGGERDRVDVERAGQVSVGVHELGHRHHFSDPNVKPLGRNHPAGTFPDPLQEAIADGYRDRFGGGGEWSVQAMSDVERTAARDAEYGREPDPDEPGLFSNYGQTGYSTNYRPGGEVYRDDWTGEDRALYAAARAHVSETGEMPQYQTNRPTGGPVGGAITPYSGERGRSTDERTGQADIHSSATIDATLHHLLTTSPHAQAALEHNEWWPEGADTPVPLAGIGEKAVERHNDRELLRKGQTIQESLFDEVVSLGTPGEPGHREHLGYTINPDQHAGGFMAGIEEFSGDVERFDRMAEERGAQGAWPEHLSYNQLGQSPRKWEDVQESLGLHRGSRDRVEKRLNPKP